MYSVTKKIDFCYGHRLLDYDGICKHPHGHNATAEIEVRTGTLDNRNMVCDFSDIKRIVKGWIDRELDHKMILRHDDPLVKPLQQLGEPIFIVDSNPTVERIARLIFDHAREQGLPVVKRHRLGDADVVRDLSRASQPDSADGRRLRSRRHADRFGRRSRRLGVRAGDQRSAGGRSIVAEVADDGRRRRGAAGATRARGRRARSRHAWRAAAVPRDLRSPAARHDGRRIPACRRR